MTNAVRIPMEALLEFAGMLALAIEELQSDGAFGYDVTGAIHEPWRRATMRQASEEFRNEWDTNHKELVGSLANLFTSVEAAYDNWARADARLGTDFGAAVQQAMQGVAQRGALSFPDTTDAAGVCIDVNDTSDEHYNPSPMPSYDEMRDRYGEPPGRHAPNAHRTAYSYDDYKEMWHKDQAAEKDRVLGREDQRGTGEKVKDFFGDLFN